MNIKGTAHTNAGVGSQISLEDYTISGGDQYHYGAVGLGYVVCRGRTVTLTGTPVFTVAFCYADNGRILADSNTFSGSASAGTKRYSAVNFGVISSGGATFPGGVAGTTSNGLYS